MYRSACLLRISAGQVHGVWHGASWSGNGRTEAAAGFGTDGLSGNAPPLGAALDSVLAAILPPRRITSPFVCVSLGGSHVMAAIMPFAKLPKSPADRQLVISQRFCREHRLELGSVAIIGSPLQGSKIGGGRILCLAVEQGTLREIEKGLAGRGLHADIIAPEYLLKFAQANSLELETPGIALFEESGFRTFLVWDEQGTIAHIATVRRPGQYDAEAQRRMTARIWRYAQIVGRQDTPVAVYIDGRVAGGIAADSAYPSHRLKLLEWSAAAGTEGQHRVAARPQGNERTHFSS